MVLWLVDETVASIVVVTVVALEELGHGDLIFVEEFGDRDIVVSIVVGEELGDGDFIVDEEVADLTIEEFGHGDVVLLEGLRQDLVQELDYCDFVVAEELGHCGVQVEHCQDDVVRALAKVFGDSDAVVRRVQKLGHGDIIWSIEVVINSIIGSGGGAKVLCHSDAIFLRIEELGHGGVKILAARAGTLMALEVHLNEVLGHGDIILRLLKILKQDRVLAHIHILSHSDIILCLV